MESSLRCGGSKSAALRIHAKEKFPIDSNTQLQIHGALDTGLGVPTHCSAHIRHLYPTVSASLGVGVQYNKHDNLRYCVRGKKAFSVTTNGLFAFNVKGRCDADQDFTQKKSFGAAEFVWSILDFQNDQDVRLKLGYEVFEKVPYMQIRENNWTVNADAKGRWNVRQGCFKPIRDVPAYPNEVGYG